MWHRKPRAYQDAQSDAQKSCALVSLTLKNRAWGQNIDMIADTGHQTLGLDLNIDIGTEAGDVRENATLYWLVQQWLKDKEFADFSMFVTRQLVELKSALRLCIIKLEFYLEKAIPGWKAMSEKSQIEIPKERIEAFCRKHHIRKLSLFGSVLRENFGPDSDVDVLVEFESGQTIGIFGRNGD